MSRNIRLMLTGERMPVKHPAPGPASRRSGETTGAEYQLQNLWIFVVAAVATVIVALPLAAVILVSMASLREESAHSLSGDAPGAGERAARRLLGFRTDRIEVLAARQEPASSAAGRAEVRFVHARRPVPDPAEYSADRQSRPYRVIAGQRERAGV